MSARASFPCISRRRAIQDALLAAFALAVPRGALARPERSSRFPWPFDIDGDGFISANDRALLASAAPVVRGNRIRPDSDWDARLDFLGRGNVVGDRLAHFDRLAPATGTRVPPRPITACWHYGWYGRGRRRGETATVSYLGGDYLSTDRRTEEQFNALKEEFGISADILSWIDDREVLRAYGRGYLSAANRDRRRFGLLYECQINLAAKGRIDFAPDGPHAAKLAQDFRRMGQWLAEAAGPDGSGLLRIDGRPVVYLFGSHTFGPANRDLPAVGDALTRARDGFAEAFGAYPYLVGDESIFPGDTEVGFDRRYRAQHFDAVTRYHHYDQPHVQALGNDNAVRMDAAYRDSIVALERRNMAGFAKINNRYTDEPTLVVPSSAAGFAKRGLPSLRASRKDYEDWLEAMQTLTDEHLQQRHKGRQSEGVQTAPLVLVGSWNEEFEGHALMPAAKSRALAEQRQAGFDWLYALKSRYGVAPVE
jgi:hypothetical protein